MSDTISLAVGDAYSIKHTDYTFDIEITGLSTCFVTYMATGSDVKDPDRPRTMDIPVFARWDDDGMLQAVVIEPPDIGPEPD